MPMNLSTLSCPQTSGLCQIHQLQTWAGPRLKKFILGTQSSLISVLVMKYSDKKVTQERTGLCQLTSPAFGLPLWKNQGKNSRQRVITCKRRENKLLACTQLYFPTFIQFRKFHLGMKPLTLGCILLHQLRQPRQSPQTCPQANFLQTIPH